MKQPNAADFRDSFREGAPEAPEVGDEPLFCETCDRTCERFADAAANTDMVHIRRLRKKLADIDASTTFIETAWGVGYKLRGAPGDTGHGA